jgi:hypothetical protein
MEVEEASRNCRPSGGANLRSAARVAPPPPRGPSRRHEGSIDSSYRRPVTCHRQSPRRDHRIRKPSRRRPIGHPSCIHDPTTTQGIDPSLAADADTVCNLDLGPQRQGVGGGGGGQANRVRGRRGMTASTDSSSPWSR